MAYAAQRGMGRSDGVCLDAWILAVKGPSLSIPPASQEEAKREAADQRHLGRVGWAGGRESQAAGRGRKERLYAAD